MLTSFKNLFKRSTSVATTTVRKQLNLKPTEDSISSRQQELMELFFYAPMQRIAKEGSDNSYSFGYDKEGKRVLFTARGAFLHRTDIDEKNLFDLKYYPHGNNILTAALTPFEKNKDRDILRKSVLEILMESGPDLDFEFLEQADKDEISEFTDLELLWRIYLDNFNLILIYFFNIKDLTFISERFFRALFKNIAFEELMKDCPEKDKLRVTQHEEIFKAAQNTLFPLSLNAYTLVRNTMPKYISDRMSPIRFKLKMITQNRYDSPMTISNLRGT